MVFMYMRRMQPALSVAARSSGKSSARVGAIGRSPFQFKELSALQTVPAFGAAGNRSFSSSPIVPTPFDSDKVIAASPTETIENIVENAGAVEFSSIADLGYSLSDLAIRSLDIIHATTGLPWWATIVATTIAVRTVLFPVTVKSMRNAGKMKAFQPEMEKLKEEMDANPNKDPESIKQFQTKYKALMKKHDVNPFLGMLTPLSQIPVFLGFFWGLQELAKYAPDYGTEGTLWFTDLSAADPTMALPVISSALMVASVELGGDAMPENYKEQVKFGMRCFAVAMVPLTMNFSSGVFVYWVSSNVFTVVQTAALRVPAVKRAFNIPVTETKLVSATTSQTPFQAAVTRAKEGTTISTHVHRPNKKATTQKPANK